jgi:hypothetical protein
MYRKIEKHPGYGILHKKKRKDTKQKLTIMP